MPDYTTINVDKGTRDVIRDVRDANDDPNYDVTARRLLEAAGVTDNAFREA